MDGSQANDMGIRQVVHLRVAEECCRECNNRT
jgi:hypothetical protein